MTRDEFLKYVQEQSKIFNNILNSEIVMMLEPERVVRFLNISKQASDPAVRMLIYLLYLQFFSKKGKKIPTVDNCQKKHDHRSQSFQFLPEFLNIALISFLFKKMHY